MSWLVGAYHAPVELCNAVRGLVRQAPSSLHTFNDAGSFIAAGGLQDTCFSAPPELEDNWMAVGCGLSAQQARYSVTDASGWQQLLAAGNLPTDGHYAVVKWDKHRFEAHTDALGMRTLYYVALEQGLLFSTRLDWICRLAKRHDLNFDVFGSHWLAFNQVSTKAPVHGVERLGPGGHLRYSKGDVKTTSTPWTPDSEPSSTADFADTLSTFLDPQIVDAPVSLGLSGGLDSRLLLALHEKNGRLSLHSFGPDSHPDVHIAASIAKSLSIPHKRFFNDQIHPQSALGALRDHVSQTQGMTPASATWKLQYYSTLKQQGFSMIDGGFGEVARRQFLNRLRLQGSKDLNAGRFDRLLHFVATPRAELFTESVRDRMEAGAIRQTVEAWQSMPSIQDFGLENALDLFSIRTRLPNFYGYEQSRLDAQILNYMPFAQPRVLHTLFGIPIEVRKNGRLFRELIKQRQPALRKLPLVKGDHTYPYLLPSLTAAAWTKFKSLLSAPQDPFCDVFLNSIKEFALDSVHASAVQQSSFYDAPRVTKQITEYYNGDKNKAGFVDWWLTFEIWRQEVLSPTH